MSARWDSQLGKVVQVDPEPVDPRMPAAVRPVRDSFKAAGAVLREQLEEQAQPREPSSRSALVGNGPRAELLNAAVQARTRLMQLNETDPEASDRISQALKEQRAEYEKDDVDVSHPLTNAQLTVELEEYLDDVRDEAAEQREQQAQFDALVVQVVGGGDYDRTVELLQSLPPDEYQAVMSDLSEAFFAESDHRGEYAYDDAGDGGEGGDDE